jgi:hypothetical protein
VINLGPFGAPQAVGLTFYLWAALYLGLAAVAATVGFERSDL